MIVKKLKRTSFKKSKAVMIGGLVDYILAEHDDIGKDKLAYAGSRNFLTTTVTAQKREMISLAEESIQSRMPVTHWILSWQENEQPTREQVDEAVSLFLRGMGLAEHQTFYALHKNTGNYHLHIAVNRTHPYTQKVIQPHRGFDIDEAHKIIAEIEHRQGWASQMNARYRVNKQGHVVKNLQWREGIKPKPKAEDFENATGEKSAQRIVQERGHAVIQNASCWEELHAGLDAAGLRFVRKGSGAVIFVGDTAVKGPAWTGISACPSCAKNPVNSSLATTLNGHSASPPRSRSAMCVERNGRSIRRNGKDWLKKDASPERSGRKNGKHWNVGNGNAGRRLQHILLGTGYRC